MSRSSPVTIAYQELLLKGRLKPNHSQTTLIDRLAELQQRLTANSSSRKGWWRRNQHAGAAGDSSGIYIYGGVGTGKSRLADLFTATLPPRISRRRTHFHEFMTDVHVRLHRARSENTDPGDLLVRIGCDIQRESSVLCLDEFQVSDIADAMILKRLFDSFWESGGVMVSTSNRHPNELYKNGLNRPLFVPFIEELQRRCLVLRMEGDRDYRMDGKSNIGREDIFFVDADAFRDNLMQATNGESLKPVEIDVVMGRKLKVDAVAPSLLSPTGIPSQTQVSTHPRTKAIVSSTLLSLCRTFLGATDYHALCNFASTIYVSGLQKFASDDLDTVRRFIMLVDVAYESRTQVFCLSTEPILKTFENVISSEGGAESGSEALDKLREALQHDRNLTVKGEGGSSSSKMSTFIGGVEWSATGLKEASLATGGAGETDVRFAVGRAISRLAEMSSVGYGVAD